MENASSYLSTHISIGIIFWSRLLARRCIKNSKADFVQISPKGSPSRKQRGPQRNRIWAFSRGNPKKKTDTQIFLHFPFRHFSLFFVFLTVSLSHSLSLSLFVVLAAGCKIFVLQPYFLWGFFRFVVAGETVSYPALGQLSS